MGSESPNFRMYIDESFHYIMNYLNSDRRIKIEYFNYFKQLFIFYRKRDCYRLFECFIISLCITLSIKDSSEMYKMFHEKLYFSNRKFNNIEKRIDYCNREIERIYKQQDIVALYNFNVGW